VALAEGVTLSQIISDIPSVTRVQWIPEVLAIRKAYYTQCDKGTSRSPNFQPIYDYLSGMSLPVSPGTLYLHYERFGEREEKRV